MLKLSNISKVYRTETTTVQALQDINIEFRENEFVSILGHSGCGKTTLLNLIGGLDQYTDGDLIINGISTKKYKDRDWDFYRNHSIGFVFQNYNLITHLSVLANVELALTLSGVSKKERKKKAIDALKSVGLEKQMYKKPNQMSGGQMQRVAIARALVNNPDILLADEPTGALDSATSIQIMSLLKNIAKDKLVIMVTHNPELAEEYSTRIIRLSDGKIVDDTNPYQSICLEEDEEYKKAKAKQKNNSMNIFTALSLSFKNLLTKKGRTLLTSFAGSIGIVGIATILALSNGMQLYIDKIEEDTIVSYPIEIEKTSIDMSSIMDSIMDTTIVNDEYRQKQVIYSAPILADMLSLYSSQIKTNNLEEFKSYLESDATNIKDYTNDIQYSYDLDINLYKENNSDLGYLQTNPNKLLNEIGAYTETTPMSGLGGLGNMMGMTVSSNIWEEIYDNQELLESQYDLVSGRWPTEYNEVVLITDKNNQINDYIIYSLGLESQDEAKELFDDIQNNEEIAEVDGKEYMYSDFIGQRFKLVLSSEYYVEEHNIWINKSNDKEFMTDLLEDAEEITIVGIIRPNQESISGSINGSIGYLKSLKEYVIDKSYETEIVKEQMNNSNINVFTQLEFLDEDDNKEFDFTTLSEEQQQYMATLNEEEYSKLMTIYATNTTATYDSNLNALGVIDLNSPTKIKIYPKDFDSKTAISDIISDYNTEKKNADEEENIINYSDLVGIMLQSVTKIIDVVSYVLIAFVSISLVVSSIMIGIITYISVLERTKEIGILRAIGASKKDISRVFNAETLIIGFLSGIMGIGISLLLIIPINDILYKFILVENLAKLPEIAAIILVLISIGLTMIAGLMPSKMAAKKDPVEALRCD